MLEKLQPCGEVEVKEKARVGRQAVSKDLTSSSKFSGSCVLTLQTLLISVHQGLYLRALWGKG